MAQLLQATNRLSEAEPLMRRVVLILLAFTRDTGHVHPHLRPAIRNYGALLEAMGLAARPLGMKMISLGGEVGLTAEQWRKLLGELMSN